MNWLKPVTFALSLAPLLYVLFEAYQLQSGGAHSLGADPGKAIVILQGEWAINFLIFTLLVTPIRKITGWNRIQSVRRMLGLFTFFYAALHFSAYLLFLLELDFAGVGADLAKRPYIAVGFLALLLLAPLAATSTNAMMKRLRRNWVLLHRLVYCVAALAVVHVLWIAKSSYLEAFTYGAILALLLAYRLLASARPAFFRSGMRRPA